MTTYKGPWSHGDSPSASKLNAAYIQFGLAANRPSDPHTGTRYHATDSGDYSYYNGAEWISLSTTPTVPLGARFSRFIPKQPLRTARSTHDVAEYYLFDTVGSGQQFYWPFATSTGIAILKAGDGGSGGGGGGGGGLGSVNGSVFHLGGVGSDGSDGSQGTVTSVNVSSTTTASAGAGGSGGSGGEVGSGTIPSSGSPTRTDGTDGADGVPQITFTIGGGSIFNLRAQGGEGGRGGAHAPYAVGTQAGTGGTGGAGGHGSIGETVIANLSGLTEGDTVTVNVGGGGSGGSGGEGGAGGTGGGSQGSAGGTGSSGQNGWAFIIPTYPDE